METKRPNDKFFRPYTKEDQLYRVRKKSLKKSPEAIKKFKKKYPKCMICGKPQQTDHKKTKGAGGADEEKNFWPLCWEHHTEKHRIGIKAFREKYRIEIEEWEKSHKKTIR